MSFPKHLIIEPTNACNFSCKYCPRRYSEAKNGFMDFDLYKRIIDECSGKDVIIDLFRRGESLLHPQLIDMVKYAHGKVKEINLTTNSSLLSQDLSKELSKYLTLLHFSLDTRKMFLLNRNDKYYEKVIENIKNFLTINKKVTTQVSLVKTTHSEKDIAGFINQWNPLVDRVRIYEEHTIGGIPGKLKQKRPMRQPCTKPNYEMLIYWNGEVGRCNHDWSEKPLGSIVNQSIRTFWDSKKYNNLREQHKKIMINDPVCKNCDSWYEKTDECTIGKLEKKK